MTMAVLSSVAADNDLSLTQLRVLAILRDRRVRMSALAAYLGLDRSTMSGLIERAEKRGLVARAPDPGDGRAVDVFLTRERRRARRRALRPDRAGAGARDGQARPGRAAPAPGAAQPAGRPERQSPAPSAAAARDSNREARGLRDRRSVRLFSLKCCRIFSTCRDLPFCPVARVRAALRVPDGADAYRGIRATMEQPSAGIGLDHHGRGRLSRGAEGTTQGRHVDVDRMLRLWHDGIAEGFLSSRRTHVTGAASAPVNPLVLTRTAAHREITMSQPGTLADVLTGAQR